VFVFSIDFVFLKNTSYPLSAFRGLLHQTFFKKFAITFSCTTFSAFVRKKFGCRKKVSHLGIKIAVLTACFQKTQKLFRHSKHPPI